MKSLTTASCPAFMAMSIAILPLASTVCVSAPTSSRRLATLSCPISAASCSAVLAVSSEILMSTSKSSSICTTGALPDSTALRKHLCMSGFISPFQSLILLYFSRSIRTAGSWPAAQASSRSTAGLMKPLNSTNCSSSTPKCSAKFFTFIPVHLLMKSRVRSRARKVFLPHSGPMLRINCFIRFTGKSSMSSIRCFILSGGIKRLYSCQSQTRSSSEPRGKAG